MIEVDKTYKVKCKDDVFGLADVIKIDFARIQMRTTLYKENRRGKLKKLKTPEVTYEINLNYTFKDPIFFPGRYYDSLVYLLKKFCNGNFSRIPENKNLKAADALEENKSDLYYMICFFNQHFEVNHEPSDWKDAELKVTGEWFEPVMTDSHERYVLLRDKLTDNLYIGVHNEPRKTFTAISPYFGSDGKIAKYSKTLMLTKWQVFNRKNPDNIKSQLEDGIEVKKDSE